MKNELKKIIVFSLFVLSVTCLFAITPKFVGTLGNSGTEKNPVLFGPYDYGDVTRSQTQAGPVYDERTGIIYASAGETRINAYRLTGEMIASYTMPKGFFDTHHAYMLRTDKYLYFLRRFGHARPGSLWRISLNAPDGTAAEQIKLPIKSILVMSTHARNGEIALLSDGDDAMLYFWNEATEQLREVGSLVDIKPFVLSLDWNSNGDFFAFAYDFVYKIVDGKVVKEGLFPKRYIGHRMLGPINHAFWDGALWGLAGCSVLRFNEETFDPAPGVTFSGRGRPTLSYIYWDEDIGSAGGIASIGKNCYAVTGKYGSIIIFKWDEKTKRCERVRRIGAIPETNSLVLSRDGVILVNNVGYLWDEPENAVTHTSWLYHAEYGIRAGEGALRFSAPWRGEQRSVVYYGPFRECNSTRMRQSDNGKLGDFTKLIGAAHTKGDIVYSLTSDGVASQFKMRAHTALDFTRTGDVKLVFAKATEGEYSSFEGVNEELCVVARNGVVVLLKPEGDTLREVKRLVKTFSPDCKLSGDRDIIAVSEKDKNKVSLYSTKGIPLAEIQVNSPGRISLCGSRLVIHDTASQRLLKYEW